MDQGVVDTLEETITSNIRHFEEIKRKLGSSEEQVGKAWKHWESKRQGLDLKIGEIEEETTKTKEKLVSLQIRTEQLLDKITKSVEESFENYTMREKKKKEEERASREMKISNEKKNLMSLLDDF